MNMYVSEFSRRIALALGLIVLATFAGCTTVSVDPTRSSLMATHSVSPGAEGMSTSETIRCRFKNGPISEELAKKYQADPAQAFLDGACKGVDEKIVVTQGAPTLASQVAVGATNALSTGLVSYVIQNRLQRQQQEFCLRTNSCGNKTEINNLNNNETTSAAAAQQSMDNKMTIVPLACQATDTCGK